MTYDKRYDIVAEKGKIFQERMGNAIEIATPKQKAGEFTLNCEFETASYEAITFEVDKGQTFRFELKDGNQILDIPMLNRYNPIHEYASQYHTGTMQGPAPGVETVIGLLFI